MEKQSVVFFYYAMVQMCIESVVCIRRSWTTWRDFFSFVRFARKEEMKVWAGTRDRANVYLPILRLLTYDIGADCASWQ